MEAYQTAGVADIPVQQPTPQTGRNDYAFACPELFDRDALDWWNWLAVMERPKFLGEACGLLGEQGKLAIVKKLFGS